jgi:Zn-dependent protease
MTTTVLGTCQQCGRELPPGALRCPACGEFAHRAALEQLSAEALAAEQTDPMRAAIAWNETLRLIPQDVPQFRQIQERIAMLTQAAGARPAPVRRDDPWPLAVAKTVGSMVISIIVYSSMFGSGWQFATGFVLLILVHELGHVAAMRWYGLSASPPIFIPFVGALINLRQSPKNAMEEAVVGIAGPIAGTAASLACFAWWLGHQDQGMYLLLAHFGFLLNLFNMLPVPPLDGGRVTAAVSPWIWMPGLLVVVAWILYDLIHGRGVQWMLVILLAYAWPRVSATLKGRQRFLPYYQIGRVAPVVIGAAYLVLGLGLIVLFLMSRPIYVDF